MPSKHKNASSGKRAAPAHRLGEFERIAYIQRLFASTTRYAGRRVKTGIGDDAAVLLPGSGELVWTVDSSVEDVHFRFDWLSEEDVGWRSFHAAASDLAAMGASPVAALSALELPKRFPDSALKGLLAGQDAACKALGCPIVGGNLAAAPVVAITTTVLGRAKGALLRSGARVGDELWLIGDVGKAAAGLACLLGGKRTVRGQAVDSCLEAWRRPRALIERGRRLVGLAHAAVDISDGLVGDAAHIAEASRVGIEIDLDALSDVLDSDLVTVAELLRRSALELAMYGGEDYALLACGEPAVRPRWARGIGRVVRGSGVWGKSKGRTRKRLGAGFDHFR